MHHVVIVMQFSDHISLACLVKRLYLRSN